MSETFDSIYPEFLNTGLVKLESLGVGRDWLALLFKAIEHFRRDIHAQGTTLGICRVTHEYIARLELFQTAGFYLVNPSNLSFELALCTPDEESNRLDGLVKAQIRAGRFAWALRQTSAVSFSTSTDSEGEQGLFHSLGIAKRVIGMFCGVFRRERNSGREMTYHLLTIFLGTCADAIAAAQQTTALKNEINALSGLLPMCAWCKKIRDDQGYWKQLESYIETHSGAVFSHGMCPECLKKCRESIVRR
jgi:hypothetical protein